MDYSNDFPYPVPQKRKRGLATMERVLETAAQLFAARGYDSVSLREIADAAGIRESSLYNHFSGKADILETLLVAFRDRAPAFRPAMEEMESLLPHITPEEAFKHVLFYFGRHNDVLAEHIAMIITNEKYKNALAAKTYYECIVAEPIAYYESLITRMVERGMVRPVDARAFAEQYNYASIALTKEYFMAKNGLADLESVVRAMIRSIRFFCAQMALDGDL